VQPLVCSPIASAILAAQGRDDGKLVPAEWNVPMKTCAEGTSIACPLRLEECVDAVLRSNGTAVRVSEPEIQRATKELAQIGLYTEPTCAQAGAAYHELIGLGMIKAGEITVIVLTSTGIKATPTIASFLGIEL
jgi:threonine synthase